MKLTIPMVVIDDCVPVFRVRPWRLWHPVMGSYKRCPIEGCPLGDRHAEGMADPSAISLLRETLQPSMDVLVMTERGQQVEVRAIRASALLTGVVSLETVRYLAVLSRPTDLTVTQGGFKHFKSRLAQATGLDPGRVSQELLKLNAFGVPAEVRLRPHHQPSRELLAMLDVGDAEGLRKALDTVKGRACFDIAQFLVVVSQRDRLRELSCLLGPSFTLPQPMAVAVHVEGYSCWVAAKSAYFADMLPEIYARLRDFNGKLIPNPRHRT